MKTPPLRILSVVGARPNFMKIAPFMRALSALDGDGGMLEHTLVHTGQHYDEAMSRSFFKVLDIPEPDIDLGIGSGSHAEQVGRTMIAFERVVQDCKPDWVVVVGDVNATCACSITARKEHVRVAHIEAGLRSFDLNMPEEINRMVTDRLSDILFTTEESANRNLEREGTPPDQVCFVGNVMIDTLEHQRDAAAALNPAEIARANQLPGQVLHAAAPEDDAYALLTLHRPSNVDDNVVLDRLVRLLVDELSVDCALLWPLHPRTRRQLELFGLWEAVLACPRICLMNPIGYREMLRLNMGARVMLTDSGGVQEECCVLGTACLTLRENTERPATLRENGGPSMLVGNDVGTIRRAYGVVSRLPRSPYRPPLWDGHAAERIAQEVLDTAARDKG